MPSDGAAATAAGSVMRRRSSDHGIGGLRQPIAAHRPAASRDGVTCGSGVWTRMPSPPSGIP